MKKKDVASGPSLPPSVRVTAQPSASELAQAFSLFAETSAKLEGAYHELQGQVQQLTGQLAVANGELRQQFEAKEALSSRLTLLLAALPGGVVVLDSNGWVVEVNPAAIEILGDGLIGMTWHDVAESLQPGGSPGEFLLQRDGQLRRIVLQQSRLNDAGETVLLLNDTTQAYLLQQQLEHHKKLSAMGEMAASLAHQLRTPLSAALLYASHLGRDDLAAPERQRFAGRVLERLKHLERMIQDMLSFVRGHEGEREFVEVGDLMHELQQIVGPLFASTGITFDVSNNCSGRRLRMDRKAFLGALVNVLENAMQFCGTPGRVELQVTAAEQDNQVVFVVRDNGKGLAESIVDRLFEPFVTTRNEGTGLGLAIVRNVVHAHGGQVQAANSVEGGAVIQISLPAGELLL